MEDSAHVAPHVGAWIEIIMDFGKAIEALSHPTWVRGLKWLFSVVVINFYQSHPTWVRGLKCKR